MNKILMALVLVAVVLAGGFFAANEKIQKNNQQANIKQAVETQKTVADVKGEEFQAEDGTVFTITFHQENEKDIFGIWKYPGPYESQGYLTINADGTYSDYEVYPDGFKSYVNQGKWSWIDKESISLTDNEYPREWVIKISELEKEFQKTSAN